MRFHYRIAICLTCGVLTGCSEQQTTNHNDGNLDVELVNTLNNIAVENAIITQHTLYPYHFTANAAQLNELGQRDLAVLARRFAAHPGTLNIQRQNVPNDLYEARVAHVLSGLKAAGVDVARISVSEGMPGGSGMPAEQVVTILQRTTDGRITQGLRTTRRVNQ
jgi:hypothetical protein